MRFVLLTFLFSVTAWAGEWSRLSDDTIQFLGKIEAGETDRYKAVAGPKDRVLIVNSDGGDVEAGVRLGLELVPRKLTVVVDGLCASSCANYIFTAGANKEVRRGFVGYHGNITSYLANDWPKLSAALKETKIVNDAQIEDLHRRFTESAKLEQEFLKLMGVSQKLFDKTQLPDKGKGDGAEYNFLVPKPETFALYGITNVAGSQDPEFHKQLGLANLHE